MVVSFSCAIKLGFRKIRSPDAVRHAAIAAFSQFGCGRIGVPAFGTAAILGHSVGTGEASPGLPSRKLTSPLLLSGLGQLESRWLLSEPGPAEADKSKPRRSK